MNATPLYAAILGHASERPHAIAAIDGAHTISYAQFAADIECVSRRLHALALAPDQLCAIHVLQPYLHWLLLIGLWRNGILSLSVDNSATPDVLAFAGAEVLLSDQGGPVFGGRHIDVDASWLGADAGTLAPFQEKTLGADQGVRLALSSGTTGAAKKIVLTRAVIDARLERVRRNPRFDASVCFMSMVSISAIEFFFSVGVWTVGGSVEFWRQPVHNALVKGELMANLLFMNTAQLNELVNALPAAHKASRSLIVLVGGSIVPKEVCDKAHRRLTHSLMIMYGSTEAGVVAINPDPFEYAAHGVCGFVVPDMEVQVIGEAGHPQGAGVAGELRIRSRSCVGHYRDDPVASAAAFRDGWFHTGDLARLSGNGLLTIIGRIDEVMNFGGWKVAPSVIESRLFKCAGVRDLAAFAAPGADGMDQLWVAVVRGDGYLHEALLALWEKADTPVKALNVGYLDAIPRNAMGKVMREQLRTWVSSSRASAPEPAASGLEGGAGMVNIDGKLYALASLSEPVRAQLASLKFVDAELERLHASLAVYQTARMAYCAALNQLLAEQSSLH
ncbi:MAG: AMP-binding protein [Pseudomonadota bacterium]